MSCSKGAQNAEVNMVKTDLNLSEKYGWYICELRTSLGKGVYCNAHIGLLVSSGC